MAENNNESPAGVENKGGELREEEKQKILNDMRKERGDILKKAQGKTEEEKRDIENTMITNVLDALVGTTLDHAADGTPPEEKRIQAFVESLTDEEKEYMKTLLTGNEGDPQKRMVDDRLNALRKSLGDEPMPPMATEIDKGIQTAVTTVADHIAEKFPRFAKNMEKIKDGIETMLNGLAAKIIELMEQSMKGLGADFSDLSLHLRLKEVQKILAKHKPPLTEDEKRKREERFKEAYKKWAEDGMKGEPPTLKKALEEPKKDERKETKEEHELRNGILEEVTTEKSKINITKKDDSSITLKRGENAIKISNAKKVVLEKKTGIDGKVTQTLIITKTGNETPIRVSMEKIDGAFDIDSTAEKKILTETDGITIPFEKIPSSTT